MMGQDSKRRAAADRVLRSSGYKTGGAMSARDDKASDARMIKKAFGQHDAQLHGGAKTRLSFAEGGMVDGDNSRPRGDRASRGKDKGAKNHIAIIVAPGNGAGSAPPAGAMPPPHPPMAAPPPGPPPGPPPMAGPPPGLPPGGGLPPGIMPGRPMAGPPPGMAMMRKAGGRTRLQDGGFAGPAPMPGQMPGPPGQQPFMPGVTPQDMMARGAFNPQQMIANGMTPEQISNMSRSMGQSAAATQAGMPGQYKKGGRARRASGGDADYVSPAKILEDDNPDPNTGLPGLKVDNHLKRGDRIPFAPGEGDGRYRRGGRARTMRNSALSEAADLAGPAPSPNPQKIETAAAQGEDFRPGGDDAMKRGGRPKHADGGMVGPGRLAMSAGAGSGEGRRQKARDLAYGTGGGS